LDEWVRRRALSNERGGASRTFVSLQGDSELVAGYYCLAASSLRREEASTELRRNMPDPTPIVLIGRLAVDTRFKGHGLGYSLLQDAIAKSFEVSTLVAARAIVVHAPSDDAQRFYEKFGFALMPNAARAMYMLMADVEETIRRVAAG
jgi:predicted GNAT family N-acyltransferase